MKASETSIAPKTLIEKIWLSWARPLVPGAAVPALLTSTSSRLNCWVTVSIALEIEVSSSTSSCRSEMVPFGSVF